MEARHIDVCICTYKRPELLKRLLDELGHQETEGRFTYSVVVVDNDRLQSAQPVVSAFANSSSVPVTYFVEVEQSIPRARNRAVENASGDYVAFIDDDEFPTRRWLSTLLAACEKYGADGVLGPVKRHFDQTPPNWIIRGNFYERSVYPTGTALDWRDGRTGNVLLKKVIFANDLKPFKPEFRGGEDTNFFQRMIAKGHTFIWCEEAIAYETVPPLRWKRSFMLRRALLRGAVALSYPTTGPRDILKSVVAVPAYAIFLPFAFILGQHRFMDLLVRLCDHLGKILALAGIDLIRGPYVTQ